MTTYDLPDELEVVSDGPVRIIRLNRPDHLNAANHELHKGLAGVFPQIDTDVTATPTELAPPHSCGRGPPMSVGWRDRSLTRWLASSWQILPKSWKHAPRRSV
jgi:hypothetical protein